jgi:hypothetical protein
MTTAPVATPQPKTDPKRSPPSPTRREKDAPDPMTPDDRRADLDDPWAYMPCTD